MWICARCGTQAQRPDICSGCGSAMRPFNEPPKEDRYQFVLVARLKDGTEVFGPFPNVMAADTYWDTNYGSVYGTYEVLLMEKPHEE